MGTRINVLLDHSLADYQDQVAALSKLAPSTQAALALRDYWQFTDPSELNDELASWRVEREVPGEPLLRRFTGPGLLYLTVTPGAASVRTGGRWRGFLSIEALRHSHLLAFRAIGQALGSTCMALYADSCEVDDLFWCGRTQWECIQLMERMWGPPQPNIDSIDPRIVAASEHTVPLVWFLESTKVST